ncbi:hypothetical protein [Thauera humireducens]|uniref:hypothetical protein n=1 Tax=Thauera humireducens TaxID=1134435 RepID=UPI00311FA3C9
MLFELGQRPLLVAGGGNDLDAIELGEHVAQHRTEDGRIFDEDDAEGTGVGLGHGRGAGHSRMSP